MATNKDIMNLVRESAPASYKERIPQATQQNLNETINAILEYPNTKNEFISVLTNKVAKTIFLQKAYKNPFKFFKKGTLPYGKSIESVFVDLIEGKSFEEKFGDGSSEASSLLAKENANVKVEYYSENFRHKYKITVSDEQLKGAFLSEGGLQQLINRMVIAPLNSAEYDEFLLIKKLINSADIKKETITGFSTLSEEKQANKLTKVIKTNVAKFKFLSNKYNKQEVMTFTNPSEIVIFVTPETKALIDVDLLASAFHIEKAEFEGRLVLIDEFTTASGEVDNNTLAIIADENLIQFYDTLDTSETQRNGDHLYTNTFFHKWGIISSCGFVNALKIQK